MLILGWQGFNPNFVMEIIVSVADIVQTVVEVIVRLK